MSANINSTKKRNETTTVINNVSGATNSLVLQGNTIDGESDEAFTNFLRRFLGKRTETEILEFPTRYELVHRDTSGKTLKVLTFNILADGLAQNGEFDIENTKWLTWEYRKPLIVKYLRESEADILCLQEVTHYSELRDELSEYYNDSYFTPKMNSPCREYGHDPDGCAIFFKKNFHGKIMVFNECYFAGSNQCFQVCKFYWGDNMKHICIVNTHLKAKITREDIQKRKQQVDELLEVIMTYGTNRIIVAGDMNMTQNEDGYHKLSFVLDDTHPVGYLVGDSIHGLQQEYTTNKSRHKRVSKRVSDYIFIKNLDLVSVLKPFPPGIMRNTSLPCNWWPSDHVPLVVTLQ